MIKSRTRRGWTLIEILVVIIIIGVLVIPLASFLRGLARHVSTSGLKLNALQRTQRAFVLMDRDLPYMTMITSATPTFIEFRLDSDFLPGYDPMAPSAVATIPWRESPDVDGDRFALPSASTPVWSVGDNLMDDDDDDISPANRIDVQCRYYLDGTDLVRDFNFNEAGWNLNRTRIAQQVVSFSFGYFGFVNSPDNAGLATNGEGLVEGLTIDADLLGNGIRWDTPAELGRIDLVRVTLGCNPRVPNDRSRTDFSPPYLIARRGRV